MQTVVKRLTPTAKCALIAFALAMVFLCVAPGSSQAQPIPCLGYALTVTSSQSSCPLSFIINMQGAGGLGYSRPIYSFNSSSPSPYTETYSSDTFLNIDIGGVIYTADGIWHLIGYSKGEAFTGGWYVRITRDANGCITIEFKYVNL
ncbi:MAG: hypothetical protein ABI876_05285 [Bacteroidota bacterium]